MANASEAMILFALTFSLVASSFACSWILVDYSNTNLCKEGTGQACGPIILGYNQIPGAATIIGQDFTNKSAFNSNISLQGGAGYVFGTYGEWTQADGVGYTLTAGPSLLQGDPIIQMDSVTKTNGITTVNYLIDNVPNGDFYITPRKLGEGRTKYDIKVTFSQDGIHIAKYPDYFIFPGDLYFDQLIGAQETAPGTGSIITTTLDENSGILTIDKDGVRIYEHSNMPAWDKDIAASAGNNLYYGGAGSHNVGFVFKGTPLTSYSYVDPSKVYNKKVGGYWEGLIGWLNDTIPGLGAVTEMIATLSTIILWTLPDSVFPLWLNILLIKTQVIAILYLIARLARGGG